MPLMQGKSPKAFKSNIKAELNAGKPMKQALAIAYSTKRKKKDKMAEGGEVGVEFDQTPEEKNKFKEVQDSFNSALGTFPGEDNGMKSHPRKKPMETPDSYAEGGAVDAQRPLHSKPEGDNYELEESTASQSTPSYQTESSAKNSDDEQDLPRISEHLDLINDIMMDRKRRMMAKGGSVESYEDDSEGSSKVGMDKGPIDEPTGMYESNDSDELDAPKEDGRDSRGLNLEPVHDMEDDVHDTSDASLVGQILRERKMRRR